MITYISKSNSARYNALFSDATKALKAAGVIKDPKLEITTLEQYFSFMGSLPHLNNGEGKKYTKDIHYAHVLYNLSSVRGVPSAAQKRDGVEANMKIEEILMAQERAGKYKETISEMSNYIRKTYGKNITSYFN